MNYDSDINRVKFLASVRFVEECDVWYPFTTTASGWDELPRDAPRIWDDMGLAKSDYIGVGTSHGFLSKKRECQARFPVQE
jgi:hypothetical protein